MSTLYQLHGNLATIKSQIKALEMLWQPFDSILLLGESAAYIDWLDAYIADSEISDVQQLYVLQTDIETLDSKTQQLLNMSGRNCQVLTDEAWVALTLPATATDNLAFDKVVTLA